MTIRKRRQPTPGFKLPPPFSPITGEHAPLSAQGVWPYVAMMQVAKEDVHQNYVICRGHDIRYNKFYDYAAGDPNKPGIAVAKPYGMRRPCLYRVGQIFAAVIPLQTPNPQPATVPWRVGENPGVATVSDGHPADLYETVTELYDDDGNLIVYMFLEGEIRTMMVMALECIQLGEGGLVATVFYDCATGTWATDDCGDGEGSSGDPGVITVVDPNCWLFALPGDVFRVTNDGVIGSGCWLPESPYGLRRKVRIESRLGCGESGLATVLEPNDGGSGSGVSDCSPSPAGCTSTWTKSACEITVCNDGNRIIACDVPCEDAWVEAIPGTCVWLATPGQRATMATATLTDEYCGESPAELSGFQARDVCDWVPEPTPDTAGADVKRLGCTGDTVLLYWDESNDQCGWKVLTTPTHTFDHVLTRAECQIDGCLKVYHTTGKVGVEQCQSCEADSDTGLPTAMIDVVTGASVSYNGGSGSGCDPTASGNLSIYLNTSRICVICPTGEGGSHDAGTPVSFPLELQPVEALVDVALECDPCIGLTPTVQAFYAFCVADSEALATESCTCYECPTGSGSGS